MTTKTVSSTYFKSAYKSCVDAGCDTETLAITLDIDKPALNNPVHRFPIETYLKMLHIAEDMLGERGVGVKIGQEFRPQTFRDIGYVSISCANIAEALALNARYQPLTQEIGTTRLEIVGDVAAIVWRPYSDDHSYMRPMADAVFSGYFTVGLWMAWINVGTVMSEVQFKHGPVPYADIFERIFNCQVQFNAPRNAMVFDAEIAYRPFPQHNPELVEIISKRLDRAIAKLHSPQSPQDQAYDAIEALLPSGAPTIVDIAKLMGMSDRTLRRRLSEQGATFRQLLQTVRQDSCEIHLRDNNVSIATLAQQLGYSEQSAFSHAFRSWYNMTPKQYARFQKG